jgi:bifunctional NMN adenylyltransferase/nudix hydrolase
MSRRSVDTTGIRSAAAPAASSAPHFDICVFIGRFRPFHNGHYAVVQEALRKSRFVAIVVGSCGAPRNLRNPFIFEEVQGMIRSCLSKDEQDRVAILELEDAPYNDEIWVERVQRQVNRVAALAGQNGETAPAKIALIGHKKDSSSFYLSLFPQWEFIATENFLDLAATKIRDAFFAGAAAEYEAIVPPAVAAFLKDFTMKPGYEALVREADFIRKYRAQFADLPYPPIFTTVDAVVIQSGHLLLVRRKDYPGRGLWALPGGFLDAGEKLDDAWLRELKEETKIDVPEPVLRGSLVTSQVFDDPFRSSRGRTITHAYLVHLKPGELPRVKASSDAKAVRWIPLAEVRSSELFEDHFHIVQTLKGKLPRKHPETGA